MQRFIMLAMAMAGLTLLATGCEQGDDTLTQPAIQATGGTGVVRGEMSDDMGSFVLVVNPGRGPADDQPGPFIIRGDSLRYDDGLEALVVNLTVTNASDEIYFEPVSLTFMQLLPDTVQVLNADNDETGPGAAIVFAFEDDDALWTPDETSLARTVQFGVGQGVSVGFVARIDVGTDHPTLGSIGGLVWHDENEDGIIDEEETGIAGVEVALYGGTERNTETEDPDEVVVTAEDGTYRFDGLSAGFYTVLRVPDDRYQPTTSPQIQVLLAAEGDDVADFLSANFGCLVVDDPGEIPGGTSYVEVKGDYGFETGGVASWEVKLKDCDSNHRCKSEMYGPVTAVDLEGRTLEVMGTVIHVEDEDEGDGHGRHADLHLEDVEVGDRIKVEIEVIVEGDEILYMADKLRSAGGHYEKIKGFVTELLMEGDVIVGFRVFDTPVRLP